MCLSLRAIMFCHKVLFRRNDLGGGARMENLIAAESFTCRETIAWFSIFSRRTGTDRLSLNATYRISFPRKSRITRTGEITATQRLDLDSSRGYCTFPALIGCEFAHPAGPQIRFATFFRLRRRHVAII